MAAPGLEPNGTPDVRQNGDRRQRDDRRRGTRAGGERRRGERRGAAARAGLLLATLGIFSNVRMLPSGAPNAIAALTRSDVPLPAPPRVASPSSPYDRFIEEASALYGVSADLVRAVIQTESGFNPNAVSQAGALGLMQLMPRTARALGVKNPMDPRQNILGGVKYLSKLLDRFDGNVSLALASYNAGPTVVRRHRGIPPYKETRGYVKKITGLLEAESAAAETVTAD